MEIRADIERMSLWTTASLGWQNCPRALGLLSSVIVNLYVNNLGIFMFFVVLDSYCESVQRMIFQCMSVVGIYKMEWGFGVERPYMLVRSSRNNLT